jgi:NAD(P)-dependent dehydrogenase (short-subunit alcohol dehydrogenase family)
MRAIVTGGASGIGAAVTRQLLDEGWTVEVLDRQGPAPPGAQHIPIDLRDPEAVTRIGGELAQTPLDALVCSAGISGSAVGDGPVHQASAAAFDEVVGVNLRGTFLVTGATWPALVAARGAVVTVSSVLGLTGGGGPFRSHAYIASKGGLVALTIALAVEGRAHGIRANCVAPGLVRTPLAERAEKDDGVMTYVRARQALIDDLIAPELVARTIGFLLSPAGAAITGETIAVDAGWHLAPP